MEPVTDRPTGGSKASEPAKVCSILRDDCASTTDVPASAHTSATAVASRTFAPVIAPLPSSKNELRVFGPDYTKISQEIPRANSARTYPRSGAGHPDGLVDGRRRPFAAPAAHSGLSCRGFRAGPIGPQVDQIARIYQHYRRA